MTASPDFPVNQHATGVLVFRWCVFLLAGGYTLYQILSGDYSSPAGPFRFLTIWALLLSFFVASRNLAYTEHRSDRIWSRTVMVTAVVNAMVVALYWRLFFIDPSLVNGSKTPVWHQEFYLHLVGPVLQWIDAMIILGAFRHWWRAILPLLAVVLAYVFWGEFVLRPLSDAPVGTVTSGLPYPFLNSMTGADRVAFYAKTMGQVLAMLMVFAAIAWGIRAIRSRHARLQVAR